MQYPSPDAGQKTTSLLLAWSPLKSYGLLTIIVLLCLVPFVETAFHIDDPLFLWAAKQIVRHPADPYGFKVLWYTTEQPMFDVTKNPPLSSYYGAAVGKIAGWSEPAFHLAFILPVLGVVLGTYRLARRFCRTPLLAGAGAFLTPGILVSAGTVMCDTMMLALWIFAVDLWIEGFERRNRLYLSASGLLIAASALTKYFGISLIPLLLVYSIMRERRLGNWAWYLLIPIAALAGYQVWTNTLYGRGLLLDAAEYASSFQGIASTPLKGLVCIGFIGGCMFPSLTFAPILWPRKGILFGALLSGIAALVIGMSWTNAGALVPPEHGALVAGQLALCIASGAGVLSLAAVDLWKRRDAGSFLLSLWVLGTVLFAGLINWTVNARSILPLIPAAAILIVRRLEASERSFKLQRAKLVLPLLMSGALSLAVAWADADLANSARTAATLIHERAQAKGRRVWFQGHWGFQYYMEAAGGRPLDFGAQELGPGDLVVIPENNNNTLPLKPELVVSQEEIQVPAHPWLSTMQRKLGAGFYFYSWGPLPFVFGAVPQEHYHIFQLAPLPPDK